MATRETVRHALALLVVTFPTFDRSFGSGDAKTQAARLDVWAHSFAHRPDNLVDLGVGHLIATHSRLDVVPADLHAAIDYVELAATPDPGQAWAEVWRWRLDHAAPLTWRTGQLAAVERAGGRSWLNQDGAPRGVLAAQFRDAYAEVRAEWIAARRDIRAVVLARQAAIGTAGNLPSSTPTLAPQPKTPETEPVAPPQAAAGFLERIWAKIGPKPIDPTSGPSAPPRPVKGNVVEMLTTPCDETDADRTERLRSIATQKLKDAIK